MSINTLPNSTFTFDHGVLTGLTDDDHTQYLLASGSRALAGAWDMGSFALTNVNIDSGVITGITDLAVADGGTGVSSLSDGFVLLGSGAGAITALDVTAKGSILVGDGTTDPVALAVGANGTVLEAASGEASGLKWGTAGSGDVAGDTASADKELVRFNGTGGKIIESPVTDLATTTATLSDNADMTFYDAVNDGNPVFAYGSSATERLQIVPTYATGTQSLDYIAFDTPTASATADRGEYRFNVDAALIATIDDGGIELANAMAYFIDTSNVLNETTLGSSVVSSSLTSVGTITTGVWQGTTVAVNQGGTGVTSSTGTTNVVLSNSPTLVTPALGTPASGVMTNVTGIPVGALANGTDGELITWSAAAAPATVAVGTSGQILTSNGVGAAPTFQAAGAADNLGNHTATQDLDMNGFNVIDGGVIFLREQAAADADVVGQGQLWVNTATPNELYFTTDAGNDREIVYSGGAFHDGFSDFVANEHINHTSVTLTAGVGLSGGGDISANRTFTVDLNELTTETSIASGDFIAMVDITDSGSGKITFANIESTLNHDSLAGFVSGEHFTQANITTTGTITIGTWQGTTIAVNQGGTGVTTSTGTGNTVLSSSPTLVTPALGTPASGVMTNVTGIPIGALANGTDGELITWAADATAATVAVGTSGQILTSNGVGAAPTFQAAGAADNLGNHTATEDLKMAGFNIANGGVIFLTEQAEADIDVAGKGQLWVDTATPNILKFTDDAGTDFTIAHDATTTLSSLVSIGTITTGVWQGTTIAVDQGGSGQTTYTNGQLLIGNTTGNTLAKAALTAGNGIGVTNGAGTITITADTASLTVDGVVELATVTETNTGTDATRAVTPNGLDGWTGSAQVVTLGTISTGTWEGTTVAVLQGGTGVTTSTGTGNTVLSTSPTFVTPVLGTPASGDLANCTAAGVAQVGVVELATTAETDTGTDTGRTVTPDGLAGSVYGTKNVSIEVFGPTTDTVIGDGKKYFHIPAELNGMNLVAVHAEVISAGTTNETIIQIHELVGAVDMLNTGNGRLSVDTGETGSDTAANPAVINTTNDDVATNDVIRIDVDQVSTTAAKGLIVTLTFQTP